MQEKHEEKKLVHTLSRTPTNSAKVVDEQWSPVLTKYSTSRLEAVFNILICKESVN